MTLSPCPLPSFSKPSATTTPTRHLPPHLANSKHPQAPPRHPNSQQLHHTAQQAPVATTSRSSLLSHTTTQPVATASASSAKPERPPSEDPHNVTMHIYAHACISIHMSMYLHATRSARAWAAWATCQRDRIWETAGLHIHTHSWHTPERLLVGDVVSRGRIRMALRRKKKTQNKRKKSKRILQRWLERLRVRDVV